MSNVEWFTGLRLMPVSLPSNRGAANRVTYGVSYANEKDAINAARKLRIDEIDRLQGEVNWLDLRFNELEDIEMAAEVAKTTHLDSNPMEEQFMSYTLSQLAIDVARGVYADDAEFFQKDFDAALRTERKRCAKAALAAKLPRGFKWGHDAMEQYNFGKARAATAIETIDITEEDIEETRNPRTFQDSER